MSRSQTVRGPGRQRRRPAATTIRLRGTLNEAYGWKPRSPDTAPTDLVKRARALLETPIAEFSPADIGFLLRQRIGVDLLLDRALDLLESDPLLETEYYPGDLLCAVFRISPQHFTADETLGARVAAIANKGLAAAASVNEFGQPLLSQQLSTEIESCIKQLNTLLKPTEKI
jgi:CDI immunity proteins